MVTIRDEQAEDADRISALTSAAFTGAAHSSGTEAKIVESLRRARVLTVSMVAADPEIVRHVAFSPATIDGATVSWHGLGPVSVLPGRQGEGIGSRRPLPTNRRCRMWLSPACRLSGRSGR